MYNKYITYCLTLSGSRWHIGHCRWECTPLYRGFDTFSGGYNAAGDYFAHTSVGRYDWHEGNDVNVTAAGTHSQVIIY